jgi:hypothetical protein
MKLRTVLQAVVVLFLLGVMAETGQAQRTSALWINVSDHVNAAITLYYGNDDSASFGIDDGTLGTINIGETEGPPPPPSGEDVRWKPPAGHPANAWGTGLVPKDYRVFPASAAKKDTFKVTFGNSDFPDSTFTFSWPSQAYLAARCDSMFFVYFDPNLPGNVKVDMLANSSVDILAAGTNGIASANIYKFGANKLDEVKKENPATPLTFGLLQNYPNPFNPSTTIKFDIQKTALADLSIYNVLGQRIATLVTGQLTPGTYSTVWNGLTDNGMQVASGIFFVRMSARVDGASEPYVALRKLLLMK